MFNRVFGEQPIQPEVDVRLRGGNPMLGGESVRRTGRRKCVWHVEHGGHTAERGGGGAGGPVFLVRVAGIAKMHVDVDRARQDVKAAHIQNLASGRHCTLGADGDDDAILDGDARQECGIGRNDRSTTNDEVGGHGLLHHSIAQPPSTGRSMPVSWRETSLARNRQALATSASFVTRLRA